MNLMQRRRLLDMKERVVFAAMRLIVRRITAVYLDLLEDLRRGLIETSVRIHKDDDDDFRLRDRKPLTSNIVDMQAWIDRLSRISADELAKFYEVRLDQEAATSGLGFERADKRRLLASYIREQEVQFAGIGQRDSQRILDYLADSVQHGRDVAEIFDHLEKQVEGMTAGRLRNIVRTETAEAYSRVSGDFWETVAPEVKQTKEWLPTIGGEYDRENHNRIPEENGKIDSRSNYKITTPAGIVVEARHPQDIQLPKGERINCMCSEAREFPDPQDLRTAQQGQRLRAAEIRLQDAIDRLTAPGNQLAA